MNRSERSRFAFYAFIAFAVVGLVIDLVRGFPMLFGAIAAAGGFR